MNRIAKISTAVVVGVVVVGFAVGGLANVFQAGSDKDEAVTTIRRDGARCLATTTVNGTDQAMEGKRNHRVRWQMNDPDRCLPEGAEVELRFDGTVFWFTNRGKGRAEIKKLVQPFARVGRPPYVYKVWAVGGGTDYEMEDPELEIIQ
jgi:hypothetical protein